VLPIPEKIIESIEAIHLPTMPQTLLRFMQMADDENVSIADLTTLAGRDPALTAQVLTVANSALLRGRGESKDLAHSLAGIGTRLTRLMAACLVIQHVFSQPCDNQEYDFGGFWGHSLRVAEVSRAIAVEIRYQNIEEAYCAGLLHNIGQLLLLGGMKERYGLLLAASSDESALRAQEMKELGTNHSAVGAWLIDKWAFSSFMADAVLFHQSAADEIVAADTLSQIIWSAHKICHHYRESDPLQHEQDADFTAVHAMLGVNATAVFTLFQYSALRVARSAAALGITEAGDARTFPFASAISPLIMRHTSKNNNSAYMQMAEIVHDLAMLQPLQRLFASLQSEDEMLLSIREAAWLLFGPGPLAFLMLQPEKTVLSGARFSGQPVLLEQIKIMLDSDQSLAVDVALGKKPHAATFALDCSAPISLADVQIARILRCEGLLYVPLKNRAGTIGLMVYGASASRYARLTKSLRLMTRFAEMAATSLEDWRKKQEYEQSVTAKLTQNFARHARTLIDEAANPLGIVKNYLEIVRKRVPDQGTTWHEIDIIGEEISRVTEIIGRISDGVDEKTVVGGLDINNLIEGMFVLHGDSLFSSRGIKVEKNLEAGLSAVACDRDRIRQILYYLWKNASEATAAGGYFAISTHDNINQDGRFYIEIRMSDTGPGLPAEVMLHLFRTTAPDNGRSGQVGLGLTIVAALVKQIDGRIMCQSKTGRGTRYSILIPKNGTD